MIEAPSAQYPAREFAEYLIRQVSSLYSEPNDNNIVPISLIKVGCEGAYLQSIAQVYIIHTWGPPADSDPRKQTISAVSPPEGPFLVTFSHAGWDEGSSPYGSCGQHQISEHCQARSDGELCRLHVKTGLPVHLNGTDSCIKIQGKQRCQTNTALSKWFFDHEPP